MDISNLSLTFTAASGVKIPAVQDISLNVRCREFLSVIGPSGCGKSTLLNLIGGLLKPTSGTVTTEGTRVDGPRPDKVSYMFQEHNLFPWRNVIENVEFPLLIRGVPRDERRQNALKYIELVGLSGFEKAYASELSGGMKQRAALARALVTETELLLMDEPFGALDEQSRILLGQELVSIWSKTQKTIVFVTHSIQEAAFLSDRIAIMTRRPGRIKSVVDVNVRRPRSFEMDELNEYRRIVWEKLSAEFGGDTKL